MIFSAPYGRVGIPPISAIKIAEVAYQGLLDVCRLRRAFAFLRSVVEDLGRRIRKALPAHRRAVATPLPPFSATPLDNRDASAVDFFGRALKKRVSIGRAGLYADRLPARRRHPM